MNSTRLEILRFLEELPKGMTAKGAINAIMGYSKSVRDPDKATGYELGQYAKHAYPFDHVVIVTVSGGVADLESAPDGMDVFIHDYDNGEAYDEPCPEDAIEADENGRYQVQAYTD